MCECGPEAVAASHADSALSCSDRSRICAGQGHEVSIQVIRPGGRTDMLEMAEETRVWRTPTGSVLEREYLGIGILTHLIRLGIGFRAVGWSA